MVELEMLAAGTCRALEALTIQGGRLKPITIPAMFALLRHPRLGAILFDTGYAPRFYQVTATFPYRLYALITPAQIRPMDSAVQQLAVRGILPAEVGTVVLSHFHADHVGGLQDFPKADFVYFAPAFEAVANRSGLAAVRKAYLPPLTPDDFLARSKPVQNWSPLDESFAPFTEGCDLFGDGSCVMVPLPGHATGQTGLFVETPGGRVLLAADACWDSRMFWPGPPREQPWLTHLLLTENLIAFRETLGLLRQFHRLHPEVPIYPSHCPDVYRKWVRK